MDAESEPAGQTWGGKLDLLCRRMKLRQPGVGASLLEGAGTFRSEEDGSSSSKRRVMVSMVELIW